MAGIRSFVAVELDEAARRELGRVSAELQRCGADVKWVDPENMHVTLKFLGDVPEERIAAVGAALRQGLAGVGPITFVLGGVGAFPSVARPRVVWVGLTEGAGALAAAAARVDEVLKGLGFPPENRPFSAHLTLGRLRSDRGVGGLRRAMDALGGYRGPSVTAARVVLFSSVLRPTGPVYRPLCAIELQVGGPNQGGGFRGQK